VQAPYFIDEHASTLNHYGALGWECFSVVRSDDTTTFYFKRPL
jgi:hypothetical protein